MLKPCGGKNTYAWKQYAHVLKSMRMSLNYFFLGFKDT